MATLEIGPHYCGVVQKDKGPVSIAASNEIGHHFAPKYFRGHIILKHHGGASTSDKQLRTMKTNPAKWVGHRRRLNKFSDEEMYELLGIKEGIVLTRKNLRKRFTPKFTPNSDELIAVLEEKALGWHTPRTTLSPLFFTPKQWANELAPDESFNGHSELPLDLKKSLLELFLLTGMQHEIEKVKG